MMRRASASPSSFQLARLEHRVAHLRHDSVPEVLTVPVFTDDSTEAASAYATALDEHMAAAPPSSVVVLVTHNTVRPVGKKPFWLSPREWLDPIPAPRP
jgi:hypothetical protein